MYNKQLDTFLTVAKSGSFSRAAELLYITPSAVLQQINHLESMLNVILFHRSNHGISLTEAGKYLYDEATQIVNNNNRIREELKNYQKSDCTIHVAINEYNHPRSLYQYFLRFQNAYPHKNYQIQTTLIPDYEIASRISEIDIIECSYFENFWAEHFHFLPLGYSPICLALDKDHPLYSKSLIETNHLRNETIITMQENVWSSLDQQVEHLKSMNVSFIRISAYTPEINLMCMANHYPLLIPEAYGHLCPGFAIKSIHWNASIVDGIYYSKKASKDVLRFIEYIRQCTTSNL